MIFAKLSKVVRSDPAEVAFGSVATVELPPLPRPINIISARDATTGDPSGLVSAETQGDELLLISQGPLGSENLVIKLACGPPPGTQLATVFVAVTVSASAATIVERIDAIGTPSNHWRYDDASSSAMAARVGGVAGAWINAGDLRFGVDPLTTNAAGGKSVGFGAAASSAGHGEIELGGSGITCGAVHSWHMRLQVDQVATKYIVMACEDAAIASGQWSRELVSDGAGGMSFRLYTRDPAGIPVIYRSAAGTVPIGQAFGVTWVQGADYLAVLLDGESLPLTLESGAPTTWDAPPAGSVWVGAWRTGAAPYDGLMSELVLWDAYVLSETESASLAMAQDVAWLADFDAGAMGALPSKAIDLSPYAHPTTGAVAAIVTAPLLGTATVDGLTITYSTDNDAALADPFTATITANGVTSRTATIDIDTRTAGGGAGDENIRNLGKWMGSFGWGTTAGNTGGVGRSHQYVAYRWKADRSGTLDYLRFDINWHRENYGDGTGGDMRVTLREDSGGVPNLNGAGIVWQSPLYVGMRPPPAGVDRITAGKIGIPFGPVAVTKDTVYHIVWTNEHANVLDNWYIINNIYNISAELPYHPYDPWTSISTRVTNSTGTTFVTRHEWCPHFLLRFTDGIYVGQPVTDGGTTSLIATTANPTAGATVDGVFTEYWGMQREIMGPWQIRQRWTQDDTMTVTRARVRVWRRTDSTADPLRITVEREESGGGVTTLANVTVAASSIFRANFDNQSGTTFPCVDVSLGASVVLEAGRIYRMRVSTDAGGTGGTRYGMTAPNGGGKDTMNIGWGAWRGRGEYTINGSTWMGMHGYGVNDKDVHDWNMALHNIAP